MVVEYLNDLASGLTRKSAAFAQLNVQRDNTRTEKRIFFDIETPFLLMYIFVT